ncbi:MAG: ABC transporter permease [Anaerolineae bacterium]|nr:ABC transporter permease [Anaerolineae bacterium]
MRSFLQLTYMNFKLYLRDPIGTFFTLAFPPLMTVLFGAMYGNDPTPMFGGYGSMDISMPAYTALILGTMGFMAVPITISSYRESGVLRRFKATALKPVTYILADVVANLTITLVGMIGLVLVGWLLYRVQFEGRVIAVVLAVIFCGLAMCAIGYVIASLARGARTAQVAGMVIFYPMMFLSGASLPLELLPEGIRKVANYLPLTYVVKLLRGLWFGDTWGDHLLEVAVLGGVLVICTIVAARFFRWE